MNIKKKTYCSFSYDYCNEHDILMNIEIYSSFSNDCWIFFLNPKSSNYGIFLGCEFLLAYAKLYSFISLILNRNVKLISDNAFLLQRKKCVQLGCSPFFVCKIKYLTCDFME